MSRHSSDTRGLPIRNGKFGLREIASAANVSVATVSRVLNGNTRVDPELQRSVLKAAKLLGVDRAQRDKAKALAFLLSNRTVMHSFHSRILLGAESYCTERGWDMVFLSFAYSRQVPWKELNLPGAVQHRDVVRAVILAGAMSSNLLDLLNNKGITHVVLGNNVIDQQNSLSADTVFSDDIRGSQDMTRYLIGLGHRRIGFVGNMRLPWFARCCEGYRRAIIDAGLTPQQSSIDSEDDHECGYLGAKSILTGTERVSAIFAGNDQVAHGVYKAIRDSGLRIPNDISVVGCDDTIGALLYPRLTTIREFPEQIGRKMVELILNRISEPTLDRQEVTIPTELVKRESCRLLTRTASEILADEPAAMVGLP